MSEVSAGVLESCKFLSAHDVMKLLKVSRTMLYNLVRRQINPLPSVRIGKSRRFPLDKVRTWMEALEK